MAERDPFKSEQDRQTSELYRIVSDAVADYGLKLQGEGRVPMANAVVSMLVMMQGDTIAAVSDRRYRKALRRAMEDMLPHAIARAEGKVGSVGIIKQGGSLNG